MRKIILSIVLLVALSANAQVPGFMGKRFAVGIGGLASPAFFYPTTVEKRTVNINQRYYINFDYILGRKWIFSAAYHRYKTACELLTYDTELENKFNHGEHYVYQLSGPAISFSFTRFLTQKNQFIAPVGKYFSFGYTKCFFTFTDVKGNIYKPGTKLATGGSEGITLAYGRKRVFFKKILFDMGIEASFLVNFSQSGGSDFIKDGSDRILNGNLINLKFGAGYLF